MNEGYVPAAADPSVRSMAFNSVDQAEAELKLLGVDQRIRQIGTRSFQVDISSVCVSGSELISERYNADLALGCAGPESSIALLFTGSGEGKRRINGRDSDEIGVVYLPVAGELDFVSRGRFATESVIVPEDRFRSIVDSVSPESDLPKTASIEVAHQVAEVENLRAEIVALLNQSAPNPERVSELVDAVVVYWSGLRTVASSSRLDPTFSHRIVKQAQEFIEARYMNRICMDDLCRFCGVGVRTLQRAFRSYFDMTITEYIQTIRLDRTFRALKATKPLGATVADIAEDNGFTHLGRFSVTYKQRFGESPSCTLRSF